MNNLEKLQDARVAYEAARVAYEAARASYEAEIEVTLALAEARIEELEECLQAAIDDAKEAEAYAAEMEGGVANG